MKDIENSSIIVHAQWNAMDDFLPTSYAVNWNSGTDQAQAAAVHVDKQTYTITGLTVDTVYTITVTATTCGQESKFSTTISLYTSTSSPTFTANTNPMPIISTVDPSVTSIATMTAVTADYTDPIDITPFDNTATIMNPTIVNTTTATTMNPTTTIVNPTTATIMSLTTTIVSNPTTNPAGTTTTNETSKSLTRAM